MQPLDITSTVRHIGILTRLIDGFEYMDSGLCRLNYRLSLDSYGYFYREDPAYTQTKSFLRGNCPSPKYAVSREEFTSTNIFSWRMDNQDARFYWLKSQLEKYKNQLKEYER